MFAAGGSVGSGSGSGSGSGGGVVAETSASAYAFAVSMRLAYEMSLVLLTTLAFLRPTHALNVHF